MMDEYIRECKISKRELHIHELATRYYTECEAYDRTVCTGPVLEGEVMPATPHEMELINRNAWSVREQIISEAEREGICCAELKQAFRKLGSR